MTEMNLTEMTEAQLRELIEAGESAQAEAEAKARTAREKVEAARAAKTSEAQAAAAELQARAEAEAQRVRAREYHWADWFINKGGYQQTQQSVVADQRAAEAELLEALRNDPVTQAMAKYRATGEYRSRVRDLRDRAVRALGLPTDPNPGMPGEGFENRVDPVRRRAELIEAEAESVAAEFYDALTAAIDASVQAHDDTWPEEIQDPKVSEQADTDAAEAEFRKRARIEQLVTYVAAPNGFTQRRIRVLRDMETGETLHLDNPNDPESGEFGYVLGDEFVLADDLTPEQIEVAERAVRQSDPGRYWRMHRPN
ncbi:hypothetical protein [Micrococcus terreus]|uniref:hypothetical protein n=1 Tax=Micrococcus terreus TaxID=574650 RepID=UPI0023F93716|nr:hypothetical protein [Micrococcus terreus]